MSRMHYILMADIVGSDKQNGKDLMDRFDSLVTGINDKLKEKIKSPLTITLGDEFQGVMNTLREAVEVLLSIEEQIIKNKYNFKLRYVLNYGEIETFVNTDEAYKMLGKGLTNARRYLNELKDKRGKRFYVNLLDNDSMDLSQRVLQDKLNYAFLNYQNFIDSWRIKDYPIIYEFITGMDYKEVASKFEKDISLMWRRKESLDIEEFLAIKQLIILESMTFQELQTLEQTR